jgi:N4-gp56 family major capsid protein
MALTLQATTDFNQEAYDLRAYLSLRPEFYFDDFADVESTNESMVGKSVTFTIVNDLPIQSTALTDGTDVTPIAVSDSQINVVLAEYGAALVISAKMRGTAFIDIDPLVSNLIGFNAGISVNDVARAALDSGTNVMFASGSGATAIQSAVTTRGGITGTNTIASVDIGAARARLASANVQRFGNLYVAFAHPDVLNDVYNEVISGSQVQGWTAAQVYSDPSNIYNGEAGSYRGFRWIETPTASVYQGEGNDYGTLTTATPTVGNAVTTLAFTGGSAYAISSGGNITLTDPTGLHTQTFVTTETLAAGGTSVTVTSQNANFSYPIGTTFGPSTASNVYGTFLAGRQAFAKAYSKAPGFGPMPKVFPGPVTDYLRRLQPTSWYWLGQYAPFRTAALIRLESSSTLAGDISIVPGTGTTYDPAVDLGESGTPLE